MIVGSIFKDLLLLPSLDLNHTYLNSWQRKMPTGGAAGQTSQRETDCTGDCILLSTAFALT